MGDSILVKKAKEAMERIAPNSIYFAHPINYYMGSDLNTHGDVEERLVEDIQRRFPGHKVFNPNQDFNQDNYVLWKKETGSGMNYYFDVILPKMDMGVGLSFSEDGMFGAGVYGELEKLYGMGKDIFEIRDSGVVIPMGCLDGKRKLSIEQTRERVYGGGQ